MGVIIKDNKFLIIAEPKITQTGLPKDNLKHEIYFIIKQ